VHLAASLASARLTLRAWTRDDVDALANAIATSLEHLRPWMPWVASEPLERTARLDLIEEWQADLEAGRDAVFGLFCNGAVVGGAGLHHRSGPDTFEIGYWIHADHVRRGYATEAAATLTTTAFEDPQIAFVEIHHDRANTASSGVPRKLGFELVAVRPDAIEAPGEVGIDCCWRIGRNEWRPGEAP
jgi:RimJ/RimL family protein N-acetyltransferase